MTKESSREEPEDLSVPEKILRVQDPWDDIARSPRDVEPSPAQLEEAERRLRKHESDPGEYSSWEEIRHRLENER